MNEQPYSQQWKVQGGVRWDKKKLPESNLHVYGKDDTQIRVYNMRRSPKRREKKNTREKKTKEQVTGTRTLDSWFNYYERVTQATPRTIFISYTLNIPSKPLMIVTSFLKSDQFFLKSDQFFLPHSTNLLFGLVGPKPNPIQGPSQYWSLQL